MDKHALAMHIAQTYGIQADRPFMKYPDINVFRHESNRKWFAVVMTIPKSKLGLMGDDKIDIVNVKCAPEIQHSFLQESGIYPAYHMNRAHWLTLALDGSASADAITFLLGVSYELTKGKNT